VKAEIKYFIWAVCLGGGLVAYAHNNFSQKSDLVRIEKKVDRIVNFLITKPRKRK